MSSASRLSSLLDVAPQRKRARLDPAANSFEIKLPPLEPRDLSAKAAKRLERESVKLGIDCCAFCGQTPTVTKCDECQKVNYCGKRHRMVWVEIS